jgi:peptidoglycan/xylan/chitin deacetylase (PgdA/CDA1 family)
MKRLAKRLLAAGGHYHRRLAGSAFPGIAVLGYHGVRDDGLPEGAMPFAGLHVRAAELDAHCRLLAASCHPIGWPELEAALAGGPLPARPVLVTFDDGYRSVHRLARPILARHGIPALVFAVSRPIAERRLFWFDALARSRGEAAVEAAKALPGREWRQAAPAAPAADGDPCEPLTREELAELAAAPGITLGGHTATHPILARLDADEQRAEIEGGRRSLEEWTGRPVPAFAYPNGRPGIDYTAETAARAAAAGFAAAFTTAPGFADPTRKPLELPRFLMLAGISAAELAHRLAYAWPAAASPS